MTDWMTATEVEVAVRARGQDAFGEDAEPGEARVTADFALVLGENELTLIEGTADDLLRLLDGARASVLEAAGRTASIAKVEVLSVRHQDAATVTEVWVDGKHVTGADTTGSVVIVDANPGEGHMLSDWRATAAEIGSDESLSPAFRAAAAGAYESEEDNDQIMNDVD